MSLATILKFFGHRSSLGNGAVVRLRENAGGELALDDETLDYYSTDGSVFTLRPRAVLFPRETADVVKTVHYVVDEAHQGHFLPISARGRGTDQAGGPLGEGLILNFAKYMTAIEDVTETRLRVQPGARYGDIQKALKAKGKYLPPYPASLEIATVGGATANNSAGEKTIKYGVTKDFVERLEVVLSNGEVVETKKLDSRELDAKKGRPTFEGKVYRDLDDLLTKNHDLIEKHRPIVHKNTAGYNLWDIKKNGSFDLSQLFVGSQGTLGLVTDITFRIADYPKHFGLSVGFFKEIDSCSKAIKEILHLKPSAMELVDSHLIDIVTEQDPQLIAGLIPTEKPAIVMLVEFDDAARGVIDKKLSLTKIILKKFTYHHLETNKTEEQDRLWKLRRSAAAIMWTIEGKEKALPIIEDAIVSPALLTEFFERVYALFEKYDLKIAIWGHAGDGNFHMQPFLDLGKEVDREKLFQLMDDFYAMVFELHGSPSAEHNDGILRSPYLSLFYGADMYKLFVQIKKLFDPLGILNPYKKIGVTREFQKAHLRHEYSMAHLKVDREKLTR